MFSWSFRIVSLTLPTLLALTWLTSQPSSAVARLLQPRRIAVEVHLIGLAETIFQGARAGLPGSLAKMEKNDPHFPWVVLNERQVRAFMACAQGDRRTTHSTIKLTGDCGRPMTLRIPAPGFTGDRITQVLDWGQDGGHSDMRRITSECDLQVGVRAELATDEQMVSVRLRARLMDQTKGPVASVIANLSIPNKGTALVRGWKVARMGWYDSCPAAVSNIPVVNRVFTKKKVSLIAENVVILVTPRPAGRPLQ